MPHVSGVVSGRALQRLREHDAREAAKVERGVKRVAREAERKRRGLGGIDADHFWSFVDTAGGPNDCHLWQGETRSNHPTRPDIKCYEEGKYPVGKLHVSAHRLAVRLALNIDYIPPTLDIAPACENHLCCNLDHLVVRPHATAKRMQQSVPVREFFCNEEAKEAEYAALEKAADTILAAAA